LGNVTCAATTNARRAYAPGNMLANTALCLQETRNDSG